MTVDIISRSISTKVWERAGIELATPGSAVRLASVARQVIDWATRPGEKKSTTKINEAAHEIFVVFVFLEVKAALLLAYTKFGGS